MPKKSTHYEEGSLIHYAVIGFSNIMKLSESGLISEKLLGFNTLMFVLISSIGISHAMPINAEIFSLSFLIVFLLSLVFAFCIANIYAPILNLVSNFSTNKVDSLRTGLVVLFIALPLSVSGLLYNVNFLIKFSIGAIGLQIVLVLLGGFIKYTKEPTPDITVEPNELWKVINKVSAICGILSFLITVGLLIFS